MAISIVRLLIFLELMTCKLFPSVNYSVVIYHSFINRHSHSILVHLHIIHIFSTNLHYGSYITGLIVSIAIFPEPISVLICVVARAPIRFVFRA